MTWDEAMHYYPAVKRMANTWARKMNRLDEEDDLAQHLLIKLVEQVDLSKAKDPDGYVMGALWKKASSYFFSGKNARWFQILPLSYDENGELTLDDPSQARFGKRMVNLWDEDEEG